MDIEQANTEAVTRMMEAHPVLVGVGIARDVIPGMRDNLLLHAGPPITWDRMSGPMRGAVIGALIFEGKAKSEDVQTRLRWMNDVMAPVLADALAAMGGIDIRALLAEALHMGDEGHNRNKAGSILYLRALAPHVAKASKKSQVTAD